MSAIVRLVTASVITMGLGGASALAQLPFPATLDVPYLPQSELLCGGAALAMVERWWGRRGVFAEDFASLVRPALGGILTSDLASAARAQGWDTRVLRGTPELMRQQLDGGAPVVALIQVSPNRFHYVVLLGWRDGKVTYHDPARAPFLTVDEARFLTRWTGADRWAMVLRPAAIPAPAVLATAGIPDLGSADSLPCRPWLDRAVDAVQAQRLDEASRLLDQAGRICPDEPVVLREMAGVRFKQGRYADVIRLAGDYLAQAPDDPAGWQLLASSRYLSGDVDGALAAWNALGRPTVDLLRIDGTRGIRFQQIAGAASVPPGTVLTPSSLALAQRRVAEVPALRGAVVGYRPVPGGIVEVQVAVVERPVLDPGWRILAAGVIGAVAQHEVGVDVASPTGAGELWTASWRWASPRPRAAFGVDVPGQLLFPGVVGIEGAWETFRFGPGPGHATAFEETRRSAFAGFGGWLTAGIRPSAGLRVERWSGQRDYLAVTVGSEFRTLDNRLAISLTSERAIATSAQRSYTRGSARVAWASTPGLLRAAWSSRVGVEWASAQAPMGAWPAAGGAVPWAVPLRAHAIDGATLLAGRGIIHGGLAGDLPFARVGPLVLAAGTFLDAARVVSPADAAGDRWYLDGGVGIRIGFGGGVLRADLARGLAADRRTAFTVGVHRNWPLLER